jgi:hypothetical protein
MAARAAADSGCEGRRVSRHRQPETGQRLEREAELLSVAVPEALGAELLARSELAAVFRVIGGDLSSAVVKIVQPDRLPFVASIYAALGTQSGVLNLQASGAAGELGYLVFAFYPQTIADRIEAGPVAAAEVSRLLGPAADALVQLHRNGFVHADVKPSNLLLAPAGQAVLADLDGAAHFGTVPQRVSVGFSPPEQLTGTPLAFENDVYGFTATVISLLSGGTAWLADPTRWLESPLAAELPADAIKLLRAGIAADPSVRRLSPPQLIASLGGDAATVAQRGSVPAADLAVPDRQVLTPVPIQPAQSVEGIGPNAAANSPSVNALSASAAAPGAATDLGTELALAAHQVWGFVDLRAVTMDRLALQLQQQVPAAEPEVEERPIWRHPAMIASIIAAVLLVALSLGLIFL